jgi:hypothetical protein
MSFKEFITEGQDLSKYASKMSKLTDQNNHSAARILAATLTGDKGLIKVANAINDIIDLEGHNPISEYAHTFYKKTMKVGEKKFGADWVMHIKSNM